jgi:hypothetical protein
MSCKKRRKRSPTCLYASHEANLDTRETTLEVDRRSLGDLHVNILAHELTVDREKELADMEK